ncbi:hypothetical protein IP86_02690 [Rhodopseudomonas sp. AAP120]|uniref:Uncharacterized protein n=1 Tax=Rhodopseudomonas palustris (strain BisB5) TaxID=316057 RepID=Q138T9_RHOPS|nr:MULTISPECIES: hypothetical protein [Rhodopseudomonas]ABE39400.1 conserved hypothetical protein [Rhodopseudomonas palustris BisB5]ACF00838.1 conserved hypothetical protein [Rhodopseudomonas palustris TIE-1]KPG01738.1 hypothetical protein IP86_02690 [Rhodopseudomonas sp. AAP120]
MKQRRARMKENILADIIGFNGDRRDLYCEIGRFIFEYSALEQDLRRHLRRKAQVPFDFDAPIMSAFDFARLCNAMNAVSAIEEADGLPDPAIKHLMSKALKINDARVAVVHGSWMSTYAGDRARYVSRTSMKPANHFEFAGDLDELSDSIVKLRREISEAISAGDERRGPKIVKKRRKID